MPAKAGIQRFISQSCLLVPAFAGTTSGNSGAERAYNHFFHLKNKIGPTAASTISSSANG